RSEESTAPSSRGGSVIVRTPDVAPETSTNDEHCANFAADVWGGSLTGFQNEVRTLIDTPRGEGVEPIDYDEQGRGMFVPRNVNEARIRGIEATLFANIGDAARATVNYTTLEAKDLSNEIGRAHV